MKEIYRTNDLVKLSWLESLLHDAGIECVVLDTHASNIEGGVNAIQRRLMVLAVDEPIAMRVVKESGVLAA